MKVDIKVPEMGESVFEATISELLAPVGSYVTSGQEILELETDKVNQVLYAPESGSLSLTVEIDGVVKVGDVIGFIDTDAKPDTKTPEKPKVEETEERASSVPAPPPKLSQGGVRKTADDFIQNLDKKEVLTSASVTTPAPKKKVGDGAHVTRKKMTRLRSTIASRLVEVKNNTAMLTTFNEIDMTSIMEIRSKEQEGFVKNHGVKLGFMSFFVKATVAALKEYSIVNSFIEGDDVVTFSTYDIGVAVSTDKGLFVPVVRKCDELSYAEIEQGIKGYAEKAREGSISIEDLKGGSFTITNGGVFGSLLSTPILNPPQSAILGMHSIAKRPIAVDDKVVIRPMMYVALSYDHRLIDGKDAVLFLAHIKASLEDPTRLLLEL